MDSTKSTHPPEKNISVIYRLHRWFFAASIVLGTAATLAMVLTNPGYYNLQTGEAGLLIGYANANPIMVKINLASSVVTYYLLPVGLLIMAWLAMRRSPWLASIGAFIALLGMLPLPAIGAAIGALTYDVAHAGNNPLLVNMVQQFNNDGVMSFYNIVDVPGIVLGPVLIGIALWRARAIPTWAAILITFSRLIIFVFPFFPLPGVYLQSLSCAMLFAGSIPAALAVLRMPYDTTQNTTTPPILPALLQKPALEQTTKIAYNPKEHPKAEEGQRQ